MGYHSIVEVHVLEARRFLAVHPRPALTNMYSRFLILYPTSGMASHPLGRYHLERQKRTIPKSLLVMCPTGVMTSYLLGRFHIIDTLKRQNESIPKPWTYTRIMRVTLNPRSWSLGFVIVMHHSITFDLLFCHLVLSQ